jgi:superfamily II DNA helicase RecQ
VDECHCITTWASFRPEFRRFEFLTDQFPHFLFYFTSATITERQANHIQVLFGLKKEDTKVIRLSNERTNVQIVIIDMVYPSMTHEDLLCFLHPLPSARNPRRPFLVYVNTITEAESAATFLCAVLKEIDPAIEDK